MGSGDEALSPMLTAGTTLGPYEILALLGAGGRGEVYRARDTRLGRDVAIKAIHAEPARDPARIKRFEQEDPVKRRRGAWPAESAGCRRPTSPRPS
jgi:serine/threonine protein kinase